MRSVGWGLWWQGFAVHDKYWRPLLTDAAAQWDKSVAVLRTFAYADSNGGTAFRPEFSKALNVRIRGRLFDVALRRVRKRVGADNFAAVLCELFTVAAGRYEAADQSDPTLAQLHPNEDLVAKGLGVHTAMRDRLQNVEPWPTGYVSSTLAQLSHALLISKAELLRASTDHDIYDARNELRTLTSVLSMAANLLEPLFGRYAFGIGAVRDIAIRTDPDVQAMMLVPWLAVRTLPGIAAGLSTIASLGPAIESAGRDYEQLQASRQRNSQHADLLDPKRIAAGMRTAWEMEALEHELKQATKRSQKGKR